MGSFQSHFSFPRAFEVIRSFSKFSEALTHRSCQLWEFSRTEEDQRYYEDKEQLSAAEGIENECEEHGSFYLPIRLLAVCLAGVGMPERVGLVWVTANCSASPFKAEEARAVQRLCKDHVKSF